MSGRARHDDRGGDAGQGQDAGSGERGQRGTTAPPAAGRLALVTGAGAGVPGAGRVACGGGDVPLPGRHVRCGHGGHAYDLGRQVARHRDDLHLGNALASIVLSALLPPFFLLGARRLLWSLPFYWATIVMVRAAGTVVGDLLAARNALGLALSTAVTGLLFIGFLISWRSSRRDTIAVNIN